MEISMDVPSEFSTPFSPMKSIEIQLEAAEPMLHSTQQETLEEFPKKKDFEMVQFLHTKNEGEIPPLLGSYLLEGINTAHECRDESSDSEVEDNSLPLYRQVLLRDFNADNLIDLFLKERYGLRFSDASGHDFSINACYKRLSTVGYTIYAFNYKDFQPHHTYIKVNEEGFHFDGGMTIPYSSVSGIMLSNMSSTFKEYQRLGGKLSSFGLQETDCFSILSKFRNYDLAAASEKAKYDIYVYLSWKISTSSKRTSMVPMSRQQLAIAKVRTKLKLMAQKRLLFLNEFLLLGILKSLIIRGAPESTQGKIKALLDKHFRMDQKVHRIAKLMKPVQFLWDEFEEKFSERVRKSMLQKRMTANIMKKREGVKVLLNECSKININHLAMSKVLNVRTILSEKHKIKREQELNREEKFKKAMTPNLNK